MSACRPRGAFIAVMILTMALAALRPTPQTPVAEADLGSPGGIAAMPSALPAQPFLYDQGLPAITYAGLTPSDPLRGWVLVGVFCDPASPCPDDPELGVPSVSFVLDRVYPLSGAPAAAFEYSGTSVLACADGEDCDMTGGADHSVVVGVRGGGVNEVVRVIAMDLSEDQRTVDIIFVKTMVAFPPVIPSSSSTPVLVSYACNEVGLAPTSTVTGSSVTLGELWNTQGPGGGPIGASVPWDYGPLYSCGGDTPSSVDDHVNFQTDLGALSVDDPASTAGSRCSSQGVCNAALSSYPPFVATLDAGCGSGNSVGVLDSPANAATASAQLCDLDHAPNGVVTYGVLPSGDIGVATLTAQQGGLAGTTRQLNMCFVGPPALILFIAGTDVTNLDENPFTVIVVDQDGRPVADEAVECETSPASAPFDPVPSTGITGSYWTDEAGQATFDPGLVASTSDIIGGEEFELTCVVQSDPNVLATASVTVPLWWDADGDGCAGTEELGANPALGGTRDPLNPWDFYDVPVPTAFNGGTLHDRDQAVSIINDLLAVLEYAGTSDEGLPNAGPDGIPGNADDRDYDQDNNGDGQDDGLLYDRSVGAAWSDAPNGAITIIEDVLLVLAQSGHSCQADP